MTASGQPIVERSAAIDPVCGMTVGPESPHRFVHRGTEYRFCGARCLARFQADPDSFLPGGTRKSADSARTEPSTAQRGAIYTCSMDPEVRQERPGACPKCGMALEPLAPAVTTRVEWTCPMHPEIVHDAPGSCPICGMALEP